MSAAVEERALDFKGLNDELMESTTGKKIKQASAVRWVWQPFKDIKLFGNLGAEVLNSLTLAQRPVEVLRRCQPYPLTNCEYEIPIHERKRHTDFGDMLEDADLGAYSGADPKGGKIQHLTEHKFAYSSARELSEQYAKEHGLVILEPLTGTEDSNVVRQIFEMLQPVTYRLHTLQHELTEGARERLRKSTYPKDIKAMAEGCRALMLKGTAAATNHATGQMASLSRQMQLATSGHKGNRAYAEPYDEFVAEQLGVDVPRVVQTQKSSTTNDELLARLAEKELARGNENDPLIQALLEEQQLMRAELQELRAKSA